MKRFGFVFLMLSGLFFSAGTLVGKDPALDSIGQMRVKLIYGTDGDASVAGEIAKKLSEEDQKALGKIKSIQFKSYRLLGQDESAILRGYENWASPLEPSTEILVSFQPVKRVGKKKLEVLLAYWQGKRKIFSFDPTMSVGKTLYMVGPKWRNGRLILALTMEKLEVEKK